MDFSTQRRLDTKVSASFSSWKTTEAALNVCLISCTLNFLLWFQLDEAKVLSFYKDETPDAALLNQLGDDQGAGNWGRIWGQLDSSCSGDCKDRQWEIPVPVEEVPGEVQQEKS